MWHKHQMESWRKGEPSSDHIYHPGIRLLKRTCGSRGQSQINPLILLVTKPDCAGTGSTPTRAQCMSVEFNLCSCYSLHQPGRSAPVNPGNISFNQWQNTSWTWRETEVKNHSAFVFKMSIIPVTLARECSCLWYISYLTIWSDVIWVGHLCFSHEMGGQYMFFLSATQKQI